MVKDRDAHQEINEGEQHQAKEKKRQRARKIGTVLLILAGIYSVTSYGVYQQAGSVAGKAGACTVPLLFWLFGFYFFFRGGGKIV